MGEFDIALESFIGGRVEQQDSADSFIVGNTAFAVLCDGMGGYEYGAMASSLAVREFTDFFRKENPKNIPEAFLVKTEQINKKVCALRSEDGRNLRCGTTLVATAVREKQLYWISVGDSRLYLCRKNRLVQVTEDHNYFLILDKQLRSGVISDEEYKNKSPRGHELISCIGMKKLGRVNMNIKPLQLKKDDVLLLASDGLYKALDNESILSCIGISASESADKIKKKVLSKCLTLLDNTTFILIKIN